MFNVAIIGCGRWGKNYVRVFDELPNSLVSACCDSSEAARSWVQQRFPDVLTSEHYKQMLDSSQIDAVVVSTPASTHYEVARECLLHSKHVLVEKPLTLSVEDSEALITIAAEKQKVLMVGHIFLYNSAIRRMKEYVSAEDFGEIYYLHATRTNLGPIREDVNAIWDLAPHDVSIFGYLLDIQPLWVSVTGAKVLRNSREDVGFITLGYPDNAIGNIHVSWIDPNKVREVVVVGSRKRIVFDDLNNLERLRIFEKGVSPSDTEVDSFGEFRFLVRDGDIISPKVEASEPLKNQCQHFLDCIENGETPVTDGKNGLDVVRVMTAIQKSLAKNGTPVEV